MKTGFIDVKMLFEDRFKKMCLVIPHYQRGYRWRPSEVEALLSDINEEDKGYCLQPIVLKGPIIVDGQQRLTTIALIRQCLIGNDQVSLSLLGNDRSSIDKHFIDGNRKAIESAFSPEGWIHDKEDFIDKLNGCRFIVCDLDDNENEEEVFMRLNAGKIPLSSAEILKSYYLTTDDQRRNRENFLSRWLDIEETLQDDDFYYFFSHDDKRKSERYYSSRMDFLLEVYLIYWMLLSAGDNGWEKKMAREYEASPIFAFTAIHGNSIPADGLITILEKITGTMRSIYDDTELYDLYGFVSCSHPGDLLLLLSEVAGKNRIDILGSLKCKAGKIVGRIDEESLGNLDFYSPSDKSRIRNILLLHNAIRSIERGIRFDYNAYRNDNYDLEHIHARAELKGKEDLQRFCMEIINESKDKKSKYPSEFLKEFERFCNDYKEGDPDKQNKLEAWENCIWVLDCDGQVERSIDDSSSIIGWRYIPESVDAGFASGWRFTSIRNLCLLSASVNRSIGNRSFAEKRKRVTEACLRGSQLPVVTAEIFSVFISNGNYKTEDAAVWGRELGDNYLCDIDKTIRGYLK